MVQIRFFVLGPKTWSESIVWQRFLKKNQNTPRPSEHPPVMGGKMSSFGRLFGGDSKMKLPNGNDIFFFKTRGRGVQEQTSWSSTVVIVVVLELYYFTNEAQTPTYVEVLLFLFTHCRRMDTSTARQECATISRTTDAAPMLLSFAGCQNSTALRVPYTQYGFLSVFACL